MGKIFAMTPAAPAAATVQPLPHAEPVRVNLFDVTAGCNRLDAKPRTATKDEVRAYLLDLARWRGIVVPSTATISEAGIYDEGSGYILAMPGYGQDQTVIVQELDDAGEVIRTSRIGVDRKGHIGLKADAVRKIAALPNIRKPRKAKAAAATPVPAPVEPVQPVPAVVEPVAPVAPPLKPGAPSPAVETPAAAAPAVDALAERLAALEAIVARLSRPVVAGKRQRTEGERRAIERAWRYRREMRARADLDRRALEAANGAYRGALDVLARANGERDAARADRDALADRVKDGEAYAFECLAASQAADTRAGRMVRAAARHRTAARRLADDLRGAQAEARALSRRLATGSPVRARVPAFPAMVPTVDSGAVAALAR